MSGWVAEVSVADRHSRYFSGLLGHHLVDDVGEHINVAFRVILNALDKIRMSTIRLRFNKLPAPPTVSLHCNAVPFSLLPYLNHPAQLSHYF